MSNVIRLPKVLIPNVMWLLKLLLNLKYDLLTFDLLMILKATPYLR
jgi:hypothetical protein